MNFMASNMKFVYIFFSTFKPTIIQHKIMSTENEK